MKQLYRAYNVTRKEYVEAEFLELAGWLAALVCNDLSSHKTGRWVGDRIVLQCADARPGVRNYIDQRAIRNYTDITLEVIGVAR